jgi:hypothetical protein
MRDRLRCMLLLKIQLACSLIIASAQTSAKAGPEATMNLSNDPECLQVANWPPFSPKPGHPTGAEKEAFVQSIASYAKEGEARFGAPAAAIVAMAILESGYGFTRLALNASNIFGYRYPLAGAGGRPRFILKNCFLQSGESKDYILFSNFGDAVMYVSMRMSTLRSYTQATKAYSVIPLGGRTMQDIRKWVAAIAIAYAPQDPAGYSEKIVRIMNNPYRGADGLCVCNLYALSLNEQRH